MLESPFVAAVDAIATPLERAAAEAFARGARLRAAREAAERAGRLAIPPDVRARLERLGALLAGAGPEEGGAAAEQALALLAPLRTAEASHGLLERPLSALAGVGPKRQDQLRKRGLGHVSDLLFHLPVRYDDRRERTRVGRLEVGRRATFVGEVLVTDAGGVGPRGRRVFQAVVGDDTGTVNLKWFRGGDSLKSVLRKGVRVLVTGDVRRYRFSKELIHPEVDVIRDEAAGAAGEPLVPDYAVPEGVPPRTFRRWVAQAVAEYADLVPSLLPESVARRRGLPASAEALRAIHAPAPDADPEALCRGETPAHERLVLEELHLLQVGLLMRRDLETRQPSVPVSVDGARLRQASEALPFALTGAQRRALDEILADLAGPRPMMRLLQGDVGSGKTAVAWLAAVAAAAGGVQTALMAPTELLAEQHHRTLEALGEGAWLRRELLTASRPRAEAAAVRAALAQGQVDLVVGTHALLREDLEFARLGLVIVDEQHRFGVRQRAALADKAPPGHAPHVLVMTATPIPRTLALTAYGDLDLSVIDELPPGREPARTLVVRENEGRQVVEEVRASLARGEQVYVVYPLVEESEKLDLRAAVESTERIRSAFPEVAVDLVHGRLDASERAAAMRRFERGETRILVSTTVIEVGVDVPNATLMVVEHAERFGLAQLHQLRGRVGRGGARGTCLLVSRGSSEDAEARLRAMLHTTDGFRIADADLRIRGPGEFLGARQSGRLPDLRIADLVRDARLVGVARDAARETLAASPGLRGRPELARAVQARWGERLELAGVG